MPKILLLVLLLAGCSASNIPFTPYRIDIQQGNYVTQDMVDKLRPGMTRAQVQFVMGTPLIADTFNPDRWDYVYSYRDGEGKLEQEHLKLTFAGDVLQNIDRKKYEPRQLEYF